MMPLEYQESTMDLQRINLNLLVALELLLLEQSVTLSAKKLFITQAAMSHNLQQLREIFQDPLLVREKNHMVLTPYARKLQPKLSQVLQEMRSLVINGQRFVPERSERVFKIGMSDYMVSLVLPKLLTYLQAYAPGINLQIIPINHLGSSEPFERGEYDLGIGKLLLTPSSSVRSELLCRDTGVCILNLKHALAKKKTITLKEYLACEHIAVCTDRQYAPPTLIEQALAELGVERRVKVLLPFVTPIFKLIETSETLIGTMIQSMAELYQDQARYVIKPLPFKIRDLEFYVVWHHRHEEDIAHRWLREAIRLVVG